MNTQLEDQLAYIVISPPGLRTADKSVHEQLVERIKWAIAFGVLPLGTRLPSATEYAERLDVSRETMMDVYARLRAEGVTEATTSGTVIRDATQARLDVAASAFLEAFRQAISLGLGREDVESIVQGLTAEWFDRRREPRRARPRGGRRSEDAG